MEKSSNNFKRWCDSNISTMTFIFGTIAALNFIFIVITTVKINFGAATVFFSNIISVFNYKLQFPIYLYLIIILATYILSTRIKYNDTTSKKVGFSFLVGMWFNEWDVNGQHPGSERIEIKEDGRYIRNGEHIFNVENFNFNRQTNQMTLIKVSTRPNDNRKLNNTLNIVNNQFLVGQESDYAIRYTRIG